MADRLGEADARSTAATLQLDLARTQIRRSHWAITAAQALMAWLLWRDGLHVAAATWFVVATAVTFGRVYRLRAIEVHDVPSSILWPEIRRWAFAVGVLRVPPVVLAATGMPESFYLMTTVLIGLTAESVANFAGMPRLYVVWAGPPAAALVVCWLARGDLEGTWIAALLALLFVLLGFYVRDYGRVLSREVQLRESLRHERDRAESAIVAKTRFFAPASHDLRQPLAVLRWYGEAVAEHARQLGHGPLEAVAQGIGRALARAEPLLNQYLEISQLESRAEPLPHRRVDLRALLESVHESFAREAAHRHVEFRLEADPPPVALTVDSDAGSLRRILDNLVGNALKFTPSGRVTLSVRRVEEARRSPAAVEGPAVRVAVEDTGIGIAAADHERVFEEFFQVGNVERAAGRGVGLGLAIARRHAQGLGTRLHLHSELGAGTCFEFYLPPAGGDAAAPATDSDPSVSRPAPLRVMVVDDDAEVRAAMQALLHSRGWPVACARGLDEALALWREGFGPDAIVVDYRLEQGRTGAEVIAELRAAGCTVPAVIMTGDTAPERLAELRASGLPVLHKPVGERALFDLLQRLRGAAPTA